MQTLYMNNNYLDSADSDSDYFLEDLSLLEHLDLSFNYFYNLSRDYFKRFNELKVSWTQQQSSKRE